MDFESAMQTFAEAWMAANRGTKSANNSENLANNQNVSVENEESKSCDDEKVRLIIIE